MIDTDELELMLTAILNGTPKSKSPIKMNAERSAMWDKLAAEVEAMPEGDVDVGSEGTPYAQQLMHLYEKAPGRGTGGD